MDGEGIVDRQGFWDDIYRSKGHEEVSWHADHLAVSVELIKFLRPEREAAIIDIGAGRSSLAGDLLEDGYHRITVLDVAGEALGQLRERLGDAAGQPTFIRGDITEVDFGTARFDLWHDRAVFHFLTEAADREAYIHRLRSHLNPGGIAIIAGFGPDGPEKCSGLPVVRYSAGSLAEELGEGFEAVGSRLDLHRTPFDADQQFLHAWFRRAD